MYSEMKLDRDMKCLAAQIEAIKKLMEEIYERD